MSDLQAEPSSTRMTIEDCEKMSEKYKKEIAEIERERAVFEERMAREKKEDEEIEEEMKQLYEDIEKGLERAQKVKDRCHNLFLEDCALGEEIDELIPVAKRVAFGIMSGGSCGLTAKRTPTEKRKEKLSVISGRNSRSSKHGFSS